MKRKLSKIIINAAGVVMFAAVLLLNEGVEKYFWILMIIGIILFVVGVMMQKENIG